MVIIIIIIITITITITITIIIADLQKDFVNTTITNQIGRKYFLPQNAKNAKHQGGKFDKCPAKKKKQQPTKMPHSGTCNIYWQDIFPK